MILTLPSPPSRHRRDLRVAFREALAAQVRVKPQPRLYRVTVCFFGKYTKPNGEPIDRDCDSQLIVLFDELARAFGWKSDRWLQRSFSVEVIESAKEFVEVILS